MLAARTQASVALFKLGAHSTPLRSDPNLEGLKSLRCCCAKGWGAQARARSGSTLAIHIQAEKLTVGVVTARGCAH